MSSFTKLNCFSCIKNVSILVVAKIHITLNLKKRPLVHKYLERRVACIIGVILVHELSISSCLKFVGGADPSLDDSKGNSMVVNTCWSLDPASKQWYNEESMRLARKSFGLVATDSFLFAIGGQDRRERYRIITTFK